MKVLVAVILAVLAGLSLAARASVADGNPVRGRQVFRACAACHSLEPNRNMTGPSLANLWNRKSGALGSFTRYSPALKSASIVWDDKTLDDWLKDPQHFIPGNTMTFPGIRDEQQRADLLAFLKDATRAGASTASPMQQPSGQREAMQGMMGGGQALNLKKLDPNNRVQAIRYCGDTYHVTTADGKTYDFWERNLRFKTDSSGEGPEQGAPAILDAGMMGDRASVIFARPEEISKFISAGC